MAATGWRSRRRRSASPTSSAPRRGRSPASAARSPRSSTTPATPRRCATSGSRSARASVTSSSTSRSPTSPPASCRSRSPRSPASPAPGNVAETRPNDPWGHGPKNASGAGETALAVRPQVHDLTRLELALFGVLTRRLDRQPPAVVEDQLDADLEAEVGDALDLALLGGAVGLEQDLDVVRANEVVTELVDLADEAHHELVRRLLVELDRIADL